MDVDLGTATTAAGDDSRSTKGTDGNKLKSTRAADMEKKIDRNSL